MAGVRRLGGRGAMVVLLLAAAARPAVAQAFGPQPDSTTRAAILTLREQAWRTWFANDQAGFRRVVPDELIAIGWDGGPWEDREGTMAQMAQFATSGLTLRTLEFPRNVFQRYGDVVILYSTFRIIVADSAGTGIETTGRGTEVFVCRSGRWIHTGWHLDSIGGE